MQTLELLAYTLNHVYLEDRKVKTYEIPESDNNLMAAAPEPTYAPIRFCRFIYSVLLFTSVPVTSSDTDVEALRPDTWNNVRMILSCTSYC